MKFKSLLLTICLLGINSTILLADNGANADKSYSVNEWKRNLQSWKEKLTKEKELEKKINIQNHIIMIQDHLIKLVENKLGALEDWINL